MLRRQFKLKRPVPQEENEQQQRATKKLLHLKTFTHFCKEMMNQTRTHQLKTTPERKLSKVITGYACINFMEKISVFCGYLMIYWSCSRKKDVYHCPGYYCVPFRSICDLVLNCPCGFDERNFSVGILAKEDSNACMYTLIKKVDLTKRMPIQMYAK